MSHNGLVVVLRAFPGFCSSEELFRGSGKRMGENWLPLAAKRTGASIHQSKVQAIELHGKFEPLKAQI